MTLDEVPSSRRPRPIRSRVLLVDDEPANLRIAYDALKSDHEVFMATSAREALATAVRERPDIILLDVVMPEVSGFDACRWLAACEDTKDIPVLFVSACNSVEEEAEGLRIGAVDFIAKPVSPVILRARMQTHLTLKRQADLLRDLAHLDPLTGVANRRRLDAQLDIEWRACQREARSLGLLVVDVDHFKLYNDYYGHPAGDRALRAVSDTLCEALRRPRDFVARLGGEEFACVLPEGDLDATLRCAEHVCRSMVEAAWAHEASPTSDVITVSVGAAACVPRVGMSPATLLDQADSMLYVAKADGRNCARGFLEVEAAASSKSPLELVRFGAAAGGKGPS